MVLRASPGSGKTTGLPLGLLASPHFDKGKILILEPRRLAARLAAERVASTLSESPGQRIGYQYRFEKVPGTRVEFLTEGTLIRQLQSNPMLQGINTIVIDEFHERHLQTDLALGYAKWLQENHRPDLNLVVMSATLETETLERFLTPCEVIDVEAPSFPVETTFLLRPPQIPLSQLIENGITQLMKLTQGDILVFLPGKGEIRRCEDELASFARRNQLILAPLHGQTSKTEQVLALEPQPRRKVILATNVAESSLTIEGVAAVIDSGRFKMAKTSVETSLSSLVSLSTSQSSAIQRSGRAGRTQPGFCIRLFTENDFKSRPLQTIPEIHRTDLSHPLLLLYLLEIDPTKFPWISPPPPELIQKILAFLEQIDAIKDGRITELGKSLSTLPCDLRWGRALYECSINGCLKAGSHLFAHLSEAGKPPINAVNLLNQPLTPRKKKIQDQIYNSLLKGKLSKKDQSDLSTLSKSLLKGFSDQVARLRNPLSEGHEEREMIFSFGGVSSVGFDPLFTESDTFILLSGASLKTKGKSDQKVKVTCLFPIDETELLDANSALLNESVKSQWDEKRKKVITKTQLNYGAITLSESDSVAKEGQSLKTFLKYGLGIDPSDLSKVDLATWLESLDRFHQKNPVETLFAEYQWVQQYLPKWELTPIEQIDPSALFSRILSSCDSIEALKEMDLIFLTKSELYGAHLHDLGRFLKNEITLKSGRRLKVNFELGKHPWVESRIQDFFGSPSGPTLFEGRLKLTLHLLAPNRRAVQVTQDLAGFWERDYQRVRNELKRRYPRHHWPEDPIASM